MVGLKVSNYFSFTFKFENIYKFKIEIEKDFQVSKTSITKAHQTTWTSQLLAFMTLTEKVQISPKESA